MKNYENWIIDWFSKNSEYKRDTIVKNKKENYFNLGYIDSFTFITFLSEIEEKYNIRFNNDQFKDKAFSTIEGLARIVKETAEGS